MNGQQAREQWAKDAALVAQAGIVLPGVQSYRAEAWKRDYRTVPANLYGFDAQPTLATTPNAGIPAFLATTVDPDVLRVLFSPTDMAEIYGEVRKGDWTTRTWMFPVAEGTGAVTAYGDYATGGRAGANFVFPQRQQFLFQLIKEYGDLELDTAELAKINYASEVDMSAANAMMQYLNYTYAVGVSGLQNYGALNDPALPASISPTTKTGGNGNRWIYNGALNATANEVFADIQYMFSTLVAQTGGHVKMKDALTLAMSPGSEVALTATNTYNVNVADLLAKNFPNITVKTEVRYGVRSSSNPQGVVAGSMVQLIAEKLQGKPVGSAAFGEKLRAFPAVRELSSFKQKVVGGTWGTVIRQPAGVVTMIGV